MGIYPIPDELKDEDKWFKIFRTKELKFVIVIGVIDALILRLGISTGTFMLALVISAILSLGCLALIKFKIPKDKYIYGSGKPVYSYIVSKIIQFSHHCIYIKNYDIGGNNKE